jgi:hypothetical protein
VGIDRLNPPDLRYSDWHRNLDPTLGMIDLDAVECCARCWSPVALIELAAWGTRAKPATVTAELARAAGLPSYTVRYEFPEPVPLRLSIREHGAAAGSTPRVMGPAEFEQFLLDLRTRHDCPRKDR